jgi:beta-galactosidase
MAKRFAIVVSLLLVAALAGYLLGGIGASRPTAREDTAQNDVQPDQRNAAPATPSNRNAEPEDGRPDPPLSLYARLGPGADTQAVESEIAMAQKAGVRSIFVPVPVPWDGTSLDLSAPRRVAELAPEASLYFHINLNPPAEWLEANPDARARIGGVGQPYACPAADVWQAAALAALDTLATAVREEPYAARVAGCLLSALDQGYWFEQEPGDTSPANTQGFRRWLRDRYRDDATLQEAWAVEEITLDTAEIPEMPDSSDTTQVFYNLPEDRPISDFSRYLSHRNARVIALLADHIKRQVEIEFSVVVPYGFAFESPGNLSGHNDLEQVLASRIDAIASPISFAERAVGGTGGYMGPVNSALNSRKRWFILDDTRTGLANAADSAENGGGAQLEDIYAVQSRNFAAAATHQLGLVWCDIRGEGMLNDPAMWDHFAAMRLVYQDIAAAAEARAAALPLGDSRGFNHVPLTVVVDEDSRNYQRCGTPLNDRLLRDVRDSALRAGVPTQFSLLSDVLTDRAPSASVYIFTNAFKLNEADRTQLQAILERDKAVAIWMYAPGYFDTAASVENISATTGMNIAQFEGPASSGSIYGLPGTWMRDEQPFGEPAEWDPLFYIDDESASPIAYYADGEEKRVSVAVAFPETGWTSVYIAEPTLTPQLLRELLQILEIPVSLAAVRTDELATTYFPAAHFAIHAAEEGERLIQFDWTFNVVDALEDARARLNPKLNVPITGWTRKRSVNLTLEDGDTRIFRLDPVDGDSLS